MTEALQLHKCPTTYNLHNFVQLTTGVDEHTCRPCTAQQTSTLEVAAADRPAQKLHAKMAKPAKQCMRSSCRSTAAAQPAAAAALRLCHRLQMRPCSSFFSLFSSVPADSQTAAVHAAVHAAVPVRAGSRSQHHSQHTQPPPCRPRPYCWTCACDERAALHGTGVCGRLQRQDARRRSSMCRWWLQAKEPDCGKCVHPATV